LSPDGAHMVVVNSGAGMQSLQVLSLSDGSVLQTINYAAPHSVFIGFAYSPDGKSAYASGGGENVVHTFSVNADGTLAATGDVAEAKFTTDFSTSSYPTGLSVSRDGKTVYVANSNANTMAVIDTASKTVTATVPVGTSPYTTLVNPMNGTVYVSNWGDATISVYNPVTKSVVATIPVGNHPTAMVTGPYNLLFVSDSNSDAVSVVDMGTNREIGRYSVVADLPVPLGSSPQGLAVSPDGRTLYVANAGDNAVAVFAIGMNATGLYFQGWIPTAWYPTAVVVSPDGGKIYVLNGFGMGEGPNNQGLYPNPTRPAPSQPNIIGPAYCNCTFDQFSGSMDVGTLSTIPIPAVGQLVNDTRAVMRNDLFFDQSVNQRDSGNPIPTAGGTSPIKHIVYIVKENRTYDQIFGDESFGNGDSSLTLFGKSVTPNLHALAERFGLLDNFYADAQVSADGHNWALSTNASDYAEKLWPQDYSPPPGRNFGYPFEGWGGMPLSPGGYLWDDAARAGISYRDYGLYALFPPNSGTLIPANQPCSGPVATTYVGKSIPPGSVLCLPPTMPNAATTPNLVGHVDPRYQNYDMHYLDVERVTEWKREFDQYEANGNLPQLELLRLSSDHTSGTTTGLLTPQALVADNDAAVGQVVDAVSHSKDWASTAIFVTEDDAQNGPDHVDSHRTEALVISPYTSQSTPRADHTRYDTASIVRTIELILGMKPLSPYDATATPMWRLFSGTSDTTPYSAIAQAVPLATNSPHAYAARQSARLNFALPDQAPMYELNRILWHAVKGANVPYPAQLAGPRPRPIPSSYVWSVLARQHALP
ncbi:MAG: bifunctional YncE family protein/alkaline phosphatase family protein, partial [Chloroflexi bacterium]|nr:bifunctional YncE family protein/alkaline phosphatase family protein [Chloroflexota bacterium]